MAPGVKRMIAPIDVPMLSDPHVGRSPCDEFGRPPPFDRMNSDENRQGSSSMRFG